MTVKLRALMPQNKIIAGNYVFLLATISMSLTIVVVSEKHVHLCVAIKILISYSLFTNKDRFFEISTNIWHNNFQSCVIRPDIIVPLFCIISVVTLKYQTESRLFTLMHRHWWRHKISWVRHVYRWWYLKDDFTVWGENCWWVLNFLSVIISSIISVNCTKHYSWLSVKNRIC